MGLTFHLLCPDNIVWEQNNEICSAFSCTQTDRHTHTHTKPRNLKPSSWSYKIPLCSPKTPSLTVLPHTQIYNPWSGEITFQKVSQLCWECHVYTPPSITCVSSCITNWFMIVFTEFQPGSAHLCQDRAGIQPGTWEHTIPASSSWLHLACYTELTRTSSPLGTCNVLQQVLCSASWWARTWDVPQSKLTPQPICPILMSENLTTAKYQFQFYNYWYVCAWIRYQFHWVFCPFGVHPYMTSTYTIFTSTINWIYGSWKLLCIH